MKQIALIAIVAALGVASAGATTVTLSDGRSVHYAQAAIVFQDGKAVIETDTGRVTVPIARLRSIQWEAPPPPDTPVDTTKNDTQAASVLEELEATKTALKDAEQKVRSLQRLADYLRSESSKLFDRDLTHAAERAILSTQMARLEQERRLRSKALDVKAANAAALRSRQDSLDRSRYNRNSYNDRNNQYDRYDSRNSRYYDDRYDNRGSNRGYDRNDNRSFRDRYGNDRNR